MGASDSDAAIAWDTRVSRGEFLRRRYAVRRRVIFNKALGPWYVRVRRPLRPLLADRSTELVIEGYPRSANTYSVIAFEVANGEDSRLAHHLHSPINVERGIRFQTPVLVLIRRPIDAVASRLIREPFLRADDALREYVSFYKRILDVREEVVMCDFANVTTNFGAEVLRVNLRFGSEFTPYAGSLDDERRTGERIVAVERAESGGDVRPAMVARPDASRASIMRRVTAHIETAENAKLIAHASLLYTELSPSAG